MKTLRAKLLIAKWRRPSSTGLVLAVSAFAVVGSLIILRSFAANEAGTIIQAEDGQLSGIASIRNDDPNSSVSYIAFNDSILEPSPTLPGGNWYNITATTLETTRLLLKAGVKTINQPTSLEKYDNNQFLTAPAGGIVGFKDKLTGNEYAETSTGPNGILYANFTNGYLYDTGTPQFSNTQANGDCVNTDMKTGGMINYTLTVCRNHSVIKSVNRNSSSLGEEDKIKNIPGATQDRTFSAVNTPQDVVGQTALVATWRASSAACASRYGWNNPRDGQAMYCMVQQMGGNPETVYYKDHVIAAIYDKVSGDGVAFVYPKTASYQNPGQPMSGLNPFFNDQHGMEWEYLTNEAQITRYIFPISNGRGEMESVGKQILDGGYF